MRKTFTFGNKSSTTWGLYINGRGVFNSPEPDLEYISVPGRSGDLIYDNKRFKNIQITYPACFMLDNFKTNFRDFKAFMFYGARTYRKLEDDYQPDYYRMASINKAVELSDIDWVNDAGSFDLTFNCKPQLYLKSGDTFTDYLPGTTSYISNTYHFTAKPLIRTYGSGSFSFDGNVITVASNNYTYINIDCELMDCMSSNNANANSLVTFSRGTFPEMPGVYSGWVQYTIDNISGFSKVSIAPRWWIL